jgi:hypothetical protein
MPEDNTKSVYMPIMLLITFMISPVGMLSLAPIGGLCDLLPFDKVKRNYANFEITNRRIEKEDLKYLIIHTRTAFMMK